ncbi:hypothetical protein N3K66_006270 [Trichothecium roseum]|uniref:Uncharacterized protein n=1 Tax=Trichothecium roseum TaxID=47278 RepID=A0ACC0V1M6_9HYPO|nr:hypothetical protein N3K66_006270 [Trichothecium roseum]
MTAANPSLPPRPESQANAAPIPQQQEQEQQPAAPQQPPAGYALWPGSYGQAYQTYSQYAAQNQQPAAGAQQYQQQQESWQHAAGPQGVAATGLPEEKKNWVFVKMGAWALDLVVGIIVVALTVALIHASEWGMVVIMLVPIPAAALLWSGAELITRAIRKFKHGIHPGAHVALHLLITLASAVVAGICVGASVLVDPGDTSMYCSSYSTFNDGPRVYSDCYDPFGGRKDLFVALSAFYVILALVNFFLFVVACIDTSRRNKALRNRPVMVIQNPAAYWGGWQPMPQGGPPPAGAVPMNAYPHQQQGPQSQPHGQPIAVPQTSAYGNGITHDGASQISVPSPAMPVPHPQHEQRQDQQQMSEKGKEPEQQQPHAIHEFYTPGSGR